MKTVTFDEEAYEILRHLKVGPRDSFSDVVKRHLGRLAGRKASFEDAFGGWSDMTDEEVRRMREETVQGFGMAGEDPHARRGRKRPG
jgi:predicted CopG family antitoxin